MERRNDDIIANVSVPGYETFYLLRHPSPLATANAAAHCEIGTLCVCLEVRQWRRIVEQEARKAVDECLSAVL